MRRASIVVESGVILFLVSLPFGRGLAEPVRLILLVAIVGGLTACRLARSGCPALPPYRMTLPLIAFAAAAVVSTVFSTSPSFSVEAGRFLPVAFLFFLAMQHVAANERALRRLSAAIAVMIALLSVDCLYQFRFGTSLLGGTGLYAGRVTGSIPHPNDLGVIPILLPFVLALIDRSKTRWQRALLVSILPLAVAALVSSKSRNAWLGLVVALAGWLVLGGQTRLVLGLLVATALAFALAFALDIADFRSRLATVRHLEREGRIGIWLAAWEMFKDAPITGKGPHVFPRHYIEYLVRADLPEGYRPEVAYIPWAHNVYLEMLAERGLIGFGTFMAVLVAMGRRLRRALNSASAGRVQPYAAAVTVSLGVFLTMAVFDLTFLKDWVCLVFWMLAGLAARLPDLVEGAAPSGAPAAVAETSSSRSP